MTTNLRNSKTGTNLGATRSGRKLLVVVGALLCVAGLVIGLTLSATRSTASGGPRVISLEARGMAYYAGDNPERNPILHVRAGEEVRIVFRNVDRGVAHDFVIPSLRVAVDAIDQGQQGEIIFRAPASGGRYQYVCRPHAAMMNGFIEVGNR